jgi:hypothetical protein
MSAVILAALHTISDCRWSRSGCGVLGTPSDLHRERLWLCVRRPQAERVITEEECETCSRWQAATDVHRCRSPSCGRPGRFSTNAGEREKVN